MSDILRYLDEVKHCPHCKKRLSACEAPPIHVGDGLGWGSEVLFICLNDECTVFTDGWDKVEARYGHHASYRYMELPRSREKNYMMVGNADAFKNSVIDRDEVLAQNRRYAEQKELLAKLDTAVEEGDLTVPLAILLDEAAPREKRREAVAILAEEKFQERVPVLRGADQSTGEKVPVLSGRSLKSTPVSACIYRGEGVYNTFFFDRKISKEIKTWWM